MPNFITYDIEYLEYYVQYNDTHRMLSGTLECVQKFNSFLNNLTQWYSALLSYFIPSLVLMICHIKILLYLTRNTKLDQLPVSGLFKNVLTTVADPIRGNFYRG